jgi:hypothetical protein
MTIAIISSFVCAASMASATVATFVSEQPRAMGAIPLLAGDEVTTEIRGNQGGDEPGRLRPVQPPSGADAKRKPPPGGDGQGRGGRDGPPDRPTDREAGRRGQDIPIERFIEVAEDIEPGWSKTLRERLETDRDATVRAIRQNAHRLIGLVMMKERNPGLYDMKVKELQAQIEARKIARQYHEAKDANLDDECGLAMERMREVCERIVNLQLWQRASELNSLEIFVKEQRESLQRDSEPAGTKELIDTLLAEMTRTTPSQDLLDVIERATPTRGSGREARGAGRGRARGPEDGDRGPLGPGNGRFDPAVAEKLVAVARDISPAAGERLNARFSEDSEETFRSIRQGGTRFFGLVVLKDRDRNLYDMKVSELQKHLDLRAASESFHKAAVEKRSTDVARAGERMKEICAGVVELQLKQRAHEVASLSRMLDEERFELAHDSQPEETRARRDRLVIEMMDAPPRPGLAEVLEGGDAPRRGPPPNHPNPMNETPPLTPDAVMPAPQK